MVGVQHTDRAARTRVGYTSFRQVREDCGVINGHDRGWANGFQAAASSLRQNFKCEGRSRASGGTSRTRRRQP